MLSLDVSARGGPASGGRSGIRAPRSLYKSRSCPTAQKIAQRNGAIRYSRLLYAAQATPVTLFYSSYRLKGAHCAAFKKWTIRLPRRACRAANFCAEFVLFTPSPATFWYSYSNRWGEQRGRRGSEAYTHKTQCSAFCFN